MSEKRSLLDDALKEKIATLEAQAANSASSSASPIPTNESTPTSTWEIKNGVNMFGPSYAPIEY